MSNTIHPMRFERILLELGSCPSDVASHVTQTAVDLARVFGADIKALFVEEEQLFDLTDMSLTGVSSAPQIVPLERLDRPTMEAAVTRRRRSCRRVLSLLANAANVRWSFEAIRGDPVHLVQRIAGPRDFLVLTGAADTITGRSMLKLARQALATAPAVLVTGSHARDRSGPVAMIDSAAQGRGNLAVFARQVASGLREEMVALSVKADDTTIAGFRYSASPHDLGTPANPRAAMSLAAIRSALRGLKPRLLVSELAITPVSDEPESFIALMRAAGAPAIFLPRESLGPVPRH